MKTPTDELERLCVGQWRLFDSTHPADHLIAQAICAECPALAWCEQQRVKAAASSETTRPMLEGTWAGKLYGAPPNAVRILREEQEWSDADARKAHHAFCYLGLRDERTKTGERVYQRRSERKRKGWRSCVDIPAKQGDSGRISPATKAAPDGALTPNVQGLTDDRSVG